MRKDQVRDAGQALAYVIDCTLATVCSLAMKKSRSQSEFERQIAIAQTAINWALQFGVDLNSTRARDVTSTVAEWAGRFDVRKAKD